MTATAASSRAPDRVAEGDHRRSHPSLPRSRVECLLALERVRDFEAADAVCGLNAGGFCQILRSLTTEFGRPSVQWHANRFSGFISTRRVARKCKVQGEHGGR